jgi:hypothetical protein
MARLVIEMRDRSAEGAIHIQRGEVIDVLPDGWVPSRTEAANIASGKWRVIDAPGVAPEKFAVYRESLREQRFDPLGPIEVTTAKRSRRLDLAALDALGKAEFSEREIADRTILKSR